MAREPFETGGSRAALEALRDALGDETLREATGDGRPPSTAPPPARLDDGALASPAVGDAEVNGTSGAGVTRPDELGGDDMGFWTFFLLAVGVAAIGCASPLDSASGSGGDASEGGDGGSGAAGTTTTGSSTASTTSTTSTSGPITTSTSTETSTGTGAGGGDAMCEGGDCASCQTCAVTSACAAEYDACQANPDCVALNGCLNGCADTTCQQACTDSYPGGAAALQAAATCVYCTACYVSCNGAALGCP